MNERSIFIAALEKDDPAERAAYLDQTCAGDDVLRRRVERLLLAHDRADSFLAGPAADLGDTSDSPPLSEGPGTRIGPYKLLQQIGEGGMGVVYVAEQETPVRRQVALKIIKPGMDSAQVIARFEAERQALALMDHPNIAKVFDAGTTDGSSRHTPCAVADDGTRSVPATGRPFFVMELVKGVPITQFCDDHQLTPRERLELFIPVCQAVQHAHQKGIIHRDLKPSNVLVALYDDKPVPKVIDFGVARATSQKLTERTLFTAFGSVVGTLEYMSPEQAKLNALDIDTRSDVYALGVLLYELLTGSTPLDRERLKQAALDELLRRIREDETPRPSTRLGQSGAALAGISARRRTEPAKLGQVLRGELDWIVMKALEKDRTRRYETAGGLARDIQHYLADEPVEACPPSAGYRLRKLARKYKKVLVTAAAFAVLLVAAAAISLWQALRATTAEADAKVQRDAAVANEQKAKEEGQVAQHERDETRKANDHLREAQEDLRRTLYFARANLIQAAWEANNIARVRELLEQQRPGAGERDLRGFEWRYWDRLSHAELRTVEFGPRVFACPYTALSSDGRRFATVVMSYRPERGLSFETALRVWDAATGKELHSVQPPSGNDSWDGSGIRMSPDGTRFVRSSGNPPSDIAVWDAVSGKKLLAIPCPRSFTGVEFSPDGKSLRGVLKKTEKNKDQLEVKVWDAATGHELAGQPLSTDPGWAALKLVWDNAAISPDGRRVAAPAACIATDMKTFTFGIRIWDAATGKYLHTVGGRSSEFNINNPAGIRPANFFGATFSPDSSRLAAVDFLTGEAKVWDAATGKELVSFMTGAGRDAADGTRPAPGVGPSLPSLSVIALVFSPNGKLFTGLGFDRTVRVWESETGRLRLTLKGHTRTVTGVAISPDGKRLYSASADGTWKVWDAAASSKPISLNVIPLSPDGWALSRDGTHLAAVVYGLGGKQARPEVKVFDAATGRELVSFPPPPAPGGSIDHLTFSPDGKRLAGVIGPAPFGAPGGESVVRVWDAATGGELRTFPGTPQRVAHLAFSPDGRRLAAVVSVKEAGKQRDAVKVWDAATGREALTIPGGPYRLAVDGLVGPTALGMAFSPDGKHLAASVWLPEQGKQAAGVKVWDAATGREALTIPGNSYTFRNPAFSPDGKLLAVAASTGSPLGPTDTAFASSAEVKVYDAGTGQERLVLKGHYNSGVRLVLFSPDGRRIVTSSGYVQGTGQVRDEVKVWDAAGRELLTWRDVGPMVWNLAFSPDGNRLTAVGAIPFLSPLTVKVWDATPRPEKRAPEGDAAKP
jgi:WD40 repeat protein/serine/threonine protein kinase